MNFPIPALSSNTNRILLKKFTLYPFSSDIASQYAQHSLSMNATITLADKRWLYKPTPNADEVTNLCQAININPVLGSILVQRGIRTFDEAKAFFRPELSQLHDPFLMKNMAPAVVRLLLAKEKEEKVLVYGDYDVDGTTSVTMMFHFLQSQGFEVGRYIPDRYSEGYGISWQGIEFAKNEGYTLIVALDCGIKAVDKISKAVEYGIDFIVCDHHIPGEELPPGYMLNPKQEDCAYPYKELSGCGVGFKFIQAFCLAAELPDDTAWQYLDLCAISIGADIVPMTGENRTLTYFGLQKINQNPRPGVEALLLVAGFTRRGEHYDLDVEKVVFGLAPRINAAGRMEHANNALDLLLEETLDGALEKAYLVNKNNNDRKESDSSTTEMALEMIRTSERLMHSKSTVLFHPEWKKGIVGIVASRCIENFYRPTIILAEHDGKITGSARSVNGFDLYDAVEACSDLLLQFGGHTHAAGLTMLPENLEAFIEKFEEIVCAAIVPEQQVQCVEIDLEMSLDLISEKFLEVIQQMGPFGPGHMNPVFVARNLVDTGSSRELESKKGGASHLKLSFSPADKKHKIYDGIGFGLGKHIQLVKSGKPFDLSFSLEFNLFREVKSIQFQVKDITPHEL